MRFLDFHSLLSEMSSEELGSYGAIRGVEFIHRNHTDVYRVQTERGTLIAHAAADGKAYLQRLRDNLEQLAPLNDRRIPRVVTWRDGAAPPPARNWALLVYEQIPGEELSRRNFDRRAWNDLAECLARVHALDGDPTTLARTVLWADRPSHFKAFCSALSLRMESLPLGRDRVRAHLGQMAEFLDQNQSHFEVRSRLIHGDLDRKNILVNGAQVGILDWADLASGDYAFDLGMLKFMLDSVAPGLGATLIREQARTYRERFHDDSLELRLRFFLALAGLVHAFHATNDTGAFKPARAWRVRTSYLHSETQWKTPLQLDGDTPGAPAVRTEQWALDIRQPLRGLFYLLAPKRVA